MNTKIDPLPKGEFKNTLSPLLLEYSPHLTIRENDWNKCYHFYIGYVQCFTTLINYPGDLNYAHNFIIEESLTYFLSLLQ